jgi:hypothetical protein
MAFFARSSCQVSGWFDVEILSSYLQGVVTVDYPAKQSIADRSLRLAQPILLFNRHFPSPVHMALVVVASLAFAEAEAPRPCEMSCQLALPKLGIGMCLSRRSMTPNPTPKQENAEHANTALQIQTIKRGTS